MTLHIKNRYYLAQVVMEGLNMGPAAYGQHVWTTTMLKIIQQNHPGELTP